MSLLILSSSRSSTHHRKMSGTIVAHTSNRRTLIRMRMRITTAPETSDGRALTLETHHLWRLSLTSIIIHPGTKSLITLRLGILTPTDTTIKTRRSHWPLAKPTTTSRNSARNIKTNTSRHPRGTLLQSLPYPTSPTNALTPIIVHQLIYHLR